MSIFGPEYIASSLIKNIEKDIVKYDELIDPLFDWTNRINNPDLYKFIDEFGGYSGAMHYYINQLKKIQEADSGSKIRRIIRIIFEK